MPEHGSQHQTAANLQKLLLSIIYNPETEPNLVQPLTKEWQSLERFKREMRGIPPLRAASVREALDARKPKRLKPATDPIEA